jgi:hypothetical protein
MGEIFIQLIKFVAENIEAIDPKLSSAILGLIVLALLLFITQSRPPSPQGSDALKPVKSVVSGDPEDEANELEALRKEIDERDKQIEKLKFNPDFSSLEHLYFNLNGIVNAAFALAAAFLIFEYWTLVRRTRAVSEKIVAMPLDTARSSLTKEISDGLKSVPDDVSILMAALVITLLISSLLVSIARLGRGKSFAIINRAFQLSSLVAIVVFLTVAIFITSIRT